MTVDDETKDALAKRPPHKRIKVEADVWFQPNGDMVINWDSFVNDVQVTEAHFDDINLIALCLTHIFNESKRSIQGRTKH